MPNTKKKGVKATNKREREREREREVGRKSRETIPLSLSLPGMGSFQCTLNHLINWSGLCNKNCDYIQKKKLKKNQVF